MKKLMVFAAHAAVMLSLALPAAWAGPLDRRSSGTRSNPAANDMIRVPGVIGLSAGEALSTLQQAGLHPMVRKKGAVNGSREGEECKVVSQVPSPGGVAMVGSSVDITISVPAEKECPIESQNQGIQDDPYGENPGGEGVPGGGDGNPVPGQAEGGLDADIGEQYEPEGEDPSEQGAGTQRRIPDWTMPEQGTMWQPARNE